MNKKSILIICSTFPPHSAVGGLRPFYFFKYLSELGYDVSVFTIENPEFDHKMELPLPSELENKIHRSFYSKEVGHEYLRNRGLFNKVKDFIYPENSSPPGLLGKALFDIEQKINLNSIDLILSTVPDQWTITLGSRLSKKFGCKFIADFRDIYEQEAGMPRLFREKVQSYRLLVRRFFSTRKADYLLTVSKHLAFILEEKLKKPVAVVYNGFDGRSNTVSQYNKEKVPPIKIVYTGRLLNLWYRNPSILFTAIDELIEEGFIKSDEIKIEFYGTETHLVEMMTKNLKFNFVDVIEKIPFEEVKGVLENADFLLLLTNLDIKGVLTTKFFEYIPIGVPILNLPSNDDELNNLITDYKLGFNFENKEQMKQFFRDKEKYISDYPQPRSNFKTDFFSRRNQAIELSNVIDSL